MEKGGSEVGSMWQSWCRLCLCREKAHLITISSQILSTFFDFITGNQVVSPFLTICFVQGWTRFVGSLEAESLLMLPLSPLKLWVWSTPLLDDQDLLTKRKRVSEELRLLLQIEAFKRKNKIADQLLDWMKLDNETDCTFLKDLYNHLYDMYEEQGRIPFKYLIFSFLPSLRLTFQLQSSYQPFLVILLASFLTSLSSHQ